MVALAAIPASWAEIMMRREIGGCCFIADIQDSGLSQGSPDDGI